MSESQTLALPISLPTGFVFGHEWTAVERVMVANTKALKISLGESEDDFFVLGTNVRDDAMLSELIAGMQWMREAL